MTPEERQDMEFLRQSIASHDRQIGELTDRLATISEQIAANNAQIVANSAQIATNSAHISKLIEVTNQDAVAIRQLAAIAERHQERLDGIEGLPGQ